MRNANNHRSEGVVVLVTILLLIAYFVTTFVDQCG